jgi:hypothetical protein
MEKRGFELSFTFIFSLILIAVFIFVAIWAIKHFLELKDRTMIQTAIEDLKSEVAEVWQAEESRKNITLLFPSTVKAICFANLSQPLSTPNLFYSQNLQNYQQLYKNKEKNVFILPFTLRNKYDIEGAYMVSCGVVNCLNFANPLCVDVRGGKVNLVLKGLPDGKVNVSKS